MQQRKHTKGQSTTKEKQTSEYHSHATNQVSDDHTDNTQPHKATHKNKQKRNTSDKETQGVQSRNRKKIEIEIEIEIEIG